ncbi:alpha-2-macroglobulin, partial [Fusobacterium sp.]
MKKILKLVFILSLLTIAFVACKKDKGEQSTDSSQSETSQASDGYQQVLYVNEAKFNISGDLVVLFSEELDKKQDFKKLVEVEGLDGDVTIMPFLNKLIIKGNFKKDTPYNVKVSKDIKGISGTSLTDDFIKYNLYVGKKEPSLSFADSGNVLPSINNKKINFNSVNVSKVKLEVIKVYTNNITQYLKLYSNEYGVNEWELKDDLGDVVFTKEYKIDSKEDQVIKNSIDLSNTIDTKGIYYVKISAIGQDSIDYDIEKYGEPNSFGYDEDVIYARAEKTIILSDIGIVANSNNSKLDLKLLNLNTLNPIPNAKLEFISPKNQTLEEGTTNSNGEYKSKTNLDNIFYVLVKYGNEFNVLYLAGNKINYSDFDIGGSLDGSDLKLYTYTDKGYYRPGDEINVSLIARSKEKMNDNQPFEYSFTGPDGSTKINNEIVKESKNGFYTFKIKTDMNDLTGAWTLSIKFGGKEITQKVFIESKIANTIAIETDEDKIYSKADIKNGAIDFKFSFKYLSGAKVDKDSNVNFDYSVIERETKSKKYKEYTFSNPSNYKYQFRNFAETKMDDTGEVSLALEMPDALQNKNLYLSTIVNVSDTNGRYSTETKVFEIINRENSVGVQKVSQNDNEASVKYILLNEKTDSLVAGKKLKYRVYNKEFNWWYDYYNDDEKSFKENIETILLEEGEITSGSSPELLKVTKLGDGTNFIEIEDEETGHSSGVFVYNYHYGDKKHGTIENLNITADKEKYNIGDIAKIKYSGAVGSKALITIEKDGKIIKEYWKTLTVKDNEETVVIEKDFFPNAYVSISVFQKYVDKQNDRPLRLYGSVPLMVDDKTKMLTLQVDTKSEVLPGGDLKIKLSNKENKKMYYEVFLVDEGILRMTDYAKPDPYKFFYEKRAKLVQSYDNFSNIIERYSDKVANRLKTGGGDAEEDALASPMMAKKAAYEKEDMQLFGDAQRFANLTIFRDVAESDANGNATVDVKLPNFFGKMRLFVVAVSDESYGSAEKSISVKAPVIVETSAPRVLKVGDKFTV